MAKPGVLASISNWQSNLNEVQSEVDARKEDLIARVEAQLKQKTKLDPLFTVRWRVM